MPQTTIRHRRHLFLTAVMIFSLLSAACPIGAYAKENPLIYTLHLSALEPQVVEAIHPDAPLIDRVGKYKLGRILSLTHAPHMTERYSKKDGCMKQVPHPLLLDVTVTVRAQGYLTREGCKIGGYALTEGSVVSFATPLFAGVGECTAIALEEVLAP